MSEYVLSEAAERDLQQIADYTIELFGIRQSRRYKEALISCFQTLAKQPNMGSVYRLDPMISLLKFPFKAHMVFYQKTDNGIFIIRVLGRSMDFIRHL